MDCRHIQKLADVWLERALAQARAHLVELIQILRIDGGHEPVDGLQAVRQRRGKREAALFGDFHREAAAVSITALARDEAGDFEAAENLRNRRPGHIEQVRDLAGRHGLGINPDQVGENVKTLFGEFATGQFMSEVVFKSPAGIDEFEESVTL